MYVGTGCTATFGNHLWVGNGAGAQGKVIVDGGALYIPNGQLVVGWNEIGGTNYITITNSGALYISQWSSQTLGAPGSGPANIGIMDIEAGSQVVITNNALSMMNAVITNGQLIAFGGQGAVQAIYNPALNITILTCLTSGPGPQPVLLSQPTNEVMALGGTAAFSVNVGNQTVNYQWLFNNAPIADGGRISARRRPL